MPSRDQRITQILHYKRDEMREYLFANVELGLADTRDPKAYPVKRLAEMIFDAERAGKPRLEDWLAAGSPTNGSSGQGAQTTNNAHQAQGGPSTMSYGRESQLKVEFTIDRLRHAAELMGVDTTPNLQAMSPDQLVRAIVMFEDANPGKTVEGALYWEQQVQASQNGTTQPNPQSAPTEPPQEKKRGWIPWAIGGIILGVILLGILAWYLDNYVLVNKVNESESTAAQLPTATPPADTTPALTAEQIAAIAAEAAVAAVAGMDTDPDLNVEVDREAAIIVSGQEQQPVAQSSDTEVLYPQCPDDMQTPAQVAAKLGGDAGDWIVPEGSWGAWTFRSSGVESLTYPDFGFFDTSNMGKRLTKDVKTDDGSFHCEAKPTS